MDERRDRRQYDSQLRLIEKNRDLTDARLEVEIAVLKTKSDQTNTSLKSMVKLIGELESRVRKLERTTYMLLGGLIFLQLIPVLFTVVRTVAGGM